MRNRYVLPFVSCEIGCVVDVEVNVRGFSATPTR